MTTEEKAKAYDEAIKRAKAIIKIAANQDDAISFANTIFPELAESEDERIRKAIISGMKSLQEKGKYTEFAHIPMNDVFAWLEKQGEHTIACSEEQMKVLNEVLNFAANHESPYWNYYIFETLNNFIRQLKN